MMLIAYYISSCVYCFTAYTVVNCIFNSQQDQKQTWNLNFFIRFWLGKENCLLWHGRQGSHSSLWFILWSPMSKEVRRCRTFTPQPDTPSGRKMGTSRTWWRGIPRLTAQSLALLHSSGQGWLPSCTSLPAPHWLWPPSLIGSTTHSQNA